MHRPIPTRVELSHEKTDAFYKEIKEKFHGEGFDTDRTGCTSQAMYLVKGKTRLYVHPMEISGYCETLHIPQTVSYTHLDVYKRQLSRCASPMVTGPAKFNCQRNNKALDAYQNSFDEFHDWRNPVSYTHLDVYKRQM